VEQDANEKLLLLHRLFDSLHAVHMERSHIKATREDVSSAILLAKKQMAQFMHSLSSTCTGWMELHSRAVKVQRQYIQLADRASWCQLSYAMRCRMELSHVRMHTTYLVQCNARHNHDLQELERELQRVGCSSQSEPQIVPLGDAATRKTCSDTMQLWLAFLQHEVCVTRELYILQMLEQKLLDLNIALRQVLQIQSRPS